jgi:pilus assembly protein CpaB
VKTRVLTITLAAALALVGVVAVAAYVRQANIRALNGLKAETVLVAKDNVPADTSVRADFNSGLLGYATYPVSSLSKGAVPKVTSKNGSEVVTSAMAAGQVLTDNMLSSASSVTSPSGLAVPPGKIAITIDVCVPEAVADYVTAGSDVAVFDTFIADSEAATMQPSCSDEHPILGTQELEANDADTVLLLASVQVLAVGQNSGSPSTSGSSDVAATTNPASSASSSGGDVLVTFAVNQSQAEELIEIAQVGIPYLALLGSNPDLTPVPQP